MYPIIFSYKIITIGGYGIMLGIAFYTAFLMFERELKLRDIDSELAYKILLTIIPTAIIGAKLFHIFENFHAFLNNPFDMIFSGSGLTVYGGYIIALFAAIIVIRLNKANVLKVLGAAAPPMALGYAIGRLGCHVSGDGCYGIKIVPNSYIECIGCVYPNGIVPTSYPVIPTPLIESFISFIFIFILFQIRKRELTTGFVFFLYLILNGCARFAIEFIRINDISALGMTQAQIIAVFFVLAGACGLFFINRKYKTA
jgi:phosphatidylglycerol:prolipoprotein diacylglycerol transferase